MSSVNSFRTRTTLSDGGKSVQYFSLGTLEAAGFPDRCQDKLTVPWLDRPQVDDFCRETTCAKRLGRLERLLRHP